MSRSGWIRTFAVLAAAAGSVYAARTLDADYREAAERLMAAALNDEGAFARLAYLCDHFGARLAGTENLEGAIRWAAAEMKKEGFDNVLTPPARVPHWERGEESASLVSPVARPLPMLGLGGTVATPPEGITAEVIPVSSFEELEKLGHEKVAGKIVLFNVPYQGYGRTVTYRVSGPSRAAGLGAAGMLLRSVASASLQTPHTGTLDYAKDIPKIPAAAITIEDALLIQRFADRGETVRVHLKTSGRMLPDAGSANVIGEITGRELPNEVVVIGGHIDSWDVGAGAQDDGGGCITALQAAAIVKRLGLRPRRTLRVALWTNEENGGAGGRAYFEWAGDKVKDHVAAIESDGGVEKPIGFGLSMGAPAGRGGRQSGAPIDPKYRPAFEKLRQIAQLLKPIDAAEITAGGGGADIAPIMRDGVPGLALRTVGTHYFDWHHTAADTPDKVKPEDLRANVAAMAVMAYVLADMPERLLQ